MARRDFTPHLRLRSAAKPTVSSDILLAVSCGLSGVLLGVPIGFAACLLLLPS